MPADRDPTAAPDDPRAWTPMRAYRGRRSFDIEDPLVEPLWSGTRVLAHVTTRPAAGEPAAQVVLSDALGADLAPELPALARVILAGVRAHDAIVDGVITEEVRLDGVGAAAITEVRGKPGAIFVRRGIDLEIGPPSSTAEPADEGDVAEGFVAVDLLRVDGTDLLDVPLLERKRLLESVIDRGPSLLVSEHVRPPWEPWIATWKSLGLRGGMLKAANSRYHPSDDSIEWRVVERLGRGR